jgi:hypothetical protein
MKDAKIDVVDLIITSLMDHEKMLDDLVSRLENHIKTLSFEQALQIVTAHANIINDITEDNNKLDQAVQKFIIKLHDLEMISVNWMRDLELKSKANLDDIVKIY